MRRSSPASNLVARLLAEPLEVRRLLAVYNGTSGDDVILIDSRAFASGSRSTSVTINGVTQTNADDRSTIFAGNGNDTVYYHTNLESGTLSNLISVDLGAGNDLFSNYNPTTGTSVLANLQGSSAVNGGTGDDTISLGDNNGAGATVILGLFGGAIRTFRFSSNVDKRYVYNEVENFTFDGSPQRDVFNLDYKDPSLRVTANGLGGNDAMSVGAPIDPGVAAARPFSQLCPAGTTTLVGGAGVDSLTMYDITAPTVAGGYAFNFNTLTVGTAGVSYSTFEEQRLDAAAGDPVALNTFSGSLTKTTIFGSQNNPVAVGSGSLFNLSGSLDIRLGNGPSDNVTVFDQFDPGTDTYTLFGDGGSFQRLTKSDFAPGQVYLVSGARALTVSGGNAEKTYLVQSVINNLALFVNANVSNDHFTVGNGNLDADLLSSVTVNGGGGVDDVTFLNNADPSVETQTIDGNYITDGLTHSAIGMEGIILQDGVGGGTLSIPRTVVGTQVSGSFTLEVNIGGGNLDANLLGGVFVVLAGTVTIDDRLDTGNDGYTVDGNTFRKTTPGAQGVSTGIAQSTILQANDGDNVIDILSGSESAFIYSNGGNDQINVLDTVSILTPLLENINTGSERASSVAPFGDTLVINSDFSTAGDQSAGVKLIGSDVIYRLQINNGGRLVVPSGAVVKSPSLFVGNTGSIDLAGGAMIFEIPGPTPTALREMVVAGRNGGAWNGTTGPTIRSSLAASTPRSDAVGMALGAALPFNTFGGLSIAPTDTLLRYTLEGDANLDGAVNFDDLLSLAQNYSASSNATWSKGDSNYDQAVNFDDLLGLAQNYSASVLTVEPSMTAKRRRSGKLV